MGFFPTPGAGGGFPGFPGGPGGPGVPGGPGGPGGPGFPGGTPGQFPGGAPGGVQAPTAPPPQFVPQMSSTTFAIDPGGIIRRCLFRNTYIWLNNGEQFWFFPVFVGRNSIAGFRWNGFFWSYFGIDLNRISSFTCF
ncbi:transporter [Paenibacillus odorifer]|uniref:transporter n=1 Tax=Paenibacillus odorifer TaxID=189426 RepID=UPI00096E08F9|nr:transporter [Paenibacillus odorifer]OMD97046.1 transporter [Paenibacillus odorifer]